VTEIVDENEDEDEDESRDSTVAAAWGLLE
jgi:hypothetical protein